MATAACTRSASLGSTFGSALSARETVLRLTPATAATSRMVGRRPLAPDARPSPAAGPPPAWSDCLENVSLCRFTEISLRRGRGGVNVANVSARSEYFLDNARNGAYGHRIEKTFSHVERAKRDREREAAWETGIRD